MPNKITELIKELNTNETHVDICITAVCDAELKLFAARKERELIIKRILKGINNDK